MITPFVATLLQVIYYALGFVWFIVIAHVIVSWLVNFQVLNLRQPLVSQIWYLLNRLVEPMYRPIRRYMPDLGGIDLSPIVVLLGLYFFRALVVNYYYAYGGPAAF